MIANFFLKKDNDLFVKIICGSHMFKITIPIKIIELKLSLHSKTGRALGELSKPKIFKIPIPMNTMDLKLSLHSKTDKTFRRAFKTNKTRRMVLTKLQNEIQKLFTCPCVQNKFYIGGCSRTLERTAKLHKEKAIRKMKKL